MVSRASVIFVRKAPRARGNGLSEAHALPTPRSTAATFAEHDGDDESVGGNEKTEDNGPFNLNVNI